MQTEVKKANMTSIAEIAKEFEIRPGQVMTVLNDIGLSHDGANFEADKDTLDLVREGALDQLDKKVITLKPNSSPRDIAFALDIPQAEMQKSLISKFRIMKAIANPLTEDEAREGLELLNKTASQVEAQKAAAQ